MTFRTKQIDGEFWFTAKYAGELLGTTRKKIETMAARELLRYREEGGAILIAQSDVTRLRRNPKELAIAKEAAKEPAYPRRSEKMPKTTIYVGDQTSSEFKVRSRIGNPLADPAHPSKK